ncbi:MAG: hypothetical protein ACYCTV_09145 [Leptospirales bacterium]
MQTMKIVQQLSIKLGVLFFMMMAGCAAPNAEFLSPNTDLPRLKVVVLPFTNLTTTPDAGKAVTEIFLSELHIRHPFPLLPLPKGTPSRTWSPGTVDSIPPDIRTQIQAMTGADAALTGTVTEFEYRVGGTTRPVSALSWTLVSLRTGRILWAANAARMGSCFWSCRKTLSGLTKDLVDEKIRELGTH